jgi:hypothetical protein
MWEAEREFELYEEVHGYELEDESTDDFLDLESEASVDEDNDVHEYQDDFYDDEEDLY